MRARSASCIGSVHPLLRVAPNKIVRNIVGGVISPLLGEHLPALRAGRMVRAGSSSSPERRSLPDPLCGRLCATKV